MKANSIEIFAALIFILAVLQTFFARSIHQWSSQFPKDGLRRQLLLLLGEVEIIFGFWAGVLVLGLVLLRSKEAAFAYIDSRDFTEPLFVATIMIIAASRPILDFARKSIESIASFLPFKPSVSFYGTTLIVGPLLGSFITEPAAMTVTALLLLEKIYSKDVSQKLKYSTLGLLLVSISIGGTLTPYAAPPILMVARHWNWDLKFMFTHFGDKALVGVVVSTLLVTYYNLKELKNLPMTKSKAAGSPLWLQAVHLFFMTGVVLASHHVVIFLSLFIFFLGLTKVTNKFQDTLKIKEGVMVGFFLAGLVVIGGLQRWWLEPLVAPLQDLQLYLGAAFLTAFTDNAALTYLGSQLPNLTDASKYALVSGAIVGGGMTVIANAPNPAGFAILQSSFGKDGISPLKLAMAAGVPTAIALICFWFL